MNKIYFSTLLMVTATLCSPPLYAHGGGGGRDRSYNFDAIDRDAKRDAEKKVVEKKNEQDDWADFMNAVNNPEKEKDGGKAQSQNHSNGHHDGAPH